MDNLDCDFDYKMYRAGYPDAFLTEVADIVSGEDTNEVFFLDNGFMRCIEDPREWVIGEQTIVLHTEERVRREGRGEED